MQVRDKIPSLVRTTKLKLTGYTAFDQFRNEFALAQRKESETAAKSQYHPLAPLLEVTAAAAAAASSDSVYSWFSHS
jgi:hypothetical protein